MSLSSRRAWFSSACRPVSDLQPLLVEAVLDHARHEPQPGAAAGAHQFQLGGVEAEVVQASQPLVDAERLDRR